MEPHTIPARAQLKATHDGAMTLMQRRDISPTTKEILRLLASKAHEAIENESALDSTAFLEELQQIRTLDEYVTKRTEDVVRLSELETLAKLGDYGMVYCQKLKEAGESSFKKMKWVWIMDVLEAESGRMADWVAAGGQRKPPGMPMHSEIENAMEKIGEIDKAHGFWVIAFYAKRNRAMHSEILDLRLRGDYEAVLDIVQKDVARLSNLLTGDSSDDSRRYLNMVLNFRATWFELRASGDHIIWQPNAKAQDHLKQLAKDDKNAQLAHQSPETDYDKIQKKLASLSNELEEVKDLVSQGVSFARSASKLGLATLELQAATTSQALVPNTPQKRILSEHDVYTPETKRSRTVRGLSEVLPPPVDED